MKAPEHNVRDVVSLAGEFRAGNASAEAVLDGCLQRIDDPDGEGERAFRSVARDSARATAASIDTRKAAGVPLPPLAGVPISVKDLFDVEGEPTAAGSLSLADAPVARADARCIARLRQAGAVFVGRTNMTEFAYSGVGINPHFDTPRNPWDRATGRIPGGSTSGGVVSVTDGMAAGAIGSDTGGSCRIPAALSGITGFKPTAGRIPLAGVLPLSPSYDSVGALAPSVADVALLDAVMAGAPVEPPACFPVGGLRLLLVTNVMLDDVDDVVGQALDAALGSLSAAGARIDRGEMPALSMLPDLAAKGGIVAAEALAWHEDLLARCGDRYDPRVRARILAGAEQSATDYIRLLRLRGEFQASVAVQAGPWDAIVAPTVPIVAPALAEFANDDDFARLNRVLLRNPSIANVLDTGSISLPCHLPGEAPAGLMLIGRRDDDRRLLSIARGIEDVLAAGGRGWRA